MLMLPTVLTSDVESYYAVFRRVNEAKGVVN